MIKRAESAPGPRSILQTNSTSNSTPVPEMPPDLGAVRQAIELVKQHKLSDAAALAATFDDPVARKIVEWALLRDPDNPAGFDRYKNFIQANPDWPSMPLLRRRAEARLWQERRDAATVRRFVGGRKAPGMAATSTATITCHHAAAQ